MNPQQQTALPSSNLSSLSQPPYLSKRHQTPQNAAGRLPKFTPRAKQELAKKGACFYCRKVGPQAKDCLLKKLHITNAAATIKQGSQPAISTAPNEISSAVQSLMMSENSSGIPKTEGSPAAPILDSSAVHHPVTTEIAVNLAKTLVDQQTAGADMISSKFGTLNNMRLHPLQTPITLQMTMEGCKGFIRHYTKGIIHWLGWLEERIFSFAELKDWNIIPVSPPLRYTKVVIHMGTNTVTIQPPV